jgi:hypothetical protein
MKLEVLELAALEEMKKSSILLDPLRGDESLEDGIALLPYKDLFDLEESANAVQVKLGLTILSSLRPAARSILSDRVTTKGKVTLVQHLLLSLNSRITEIHELSQMRGPVPTISFAFAEDRLSADAVNVVAEIFQACGVSEETSRKLVAYFADRK